MYAIKNNVQLVGSVMEKPVIRDCGDGRKLARFSIFIEDSYNNAKGVKVRESQSHVLVAQGKVANLIATHLEKDMMVAVRGRLANRSFIDSRGQSRSVTEILISELLMLDTQSREDAIRYEFGDPVHGEIGVW